jgi:protein involved in polysaccharide export with SLBB domain
MTYSNQQPTQLIYIGFTKLPFLLACLTIFLSGYTYSQSPLSGNLLSEEFLAGLPASVRDEIEVNNQVNEEIDLENLFRSETSIDKNKIILQKLKKQILALDKRISAEDQGNDLLLSIFGQDFFSSVQSSFMPVNVPNLSGEYIVDVGDSFTLLTNGKASKEYELMVQRDGAMIVPGFGKITLAGKTLAEAENAVNGLIESTSVGVEAFLTLSKIRDVQILLLGGVESPGIYTLSGGSSILSALNVAGGIAENGSFRKIDLRRGGETVASYDLYDIFVFGNYRNDHTLRSGDTIFIHPLSYRIPVSGGVNNQAIYEVLPGETAADIISYASGFSYTFEGFDELLVSRVDLNKKEYIKLPLNQLKKFALQPRDSLLVPAFDNTIEPLRQVTIAGEVYKPGKYYVNEGETLSTVIARAGGYKESAYIFGGSLFREDALEKEKIYAQLNYEDTVKYIVSSIGKPNSSINSDALDMLAEELRSKNYTGRIVTDFNLSSLNSNPQKDIVLEANDRIVIPSLQRVVYLFGDFRKPSNLVFDPAMNVKDYIELAGGLKESAFKELVVIDPNGKTHIYDKKFLLYSPSIEVYPGSIIYAPRNIGKLSGLRYASTVSPILSSLAISLASLNSISD